MSTGDMEPSPTPTCSHCGFPLGTASGLRYFGTHTAHREPECLNLLRAEIDRLRAALATPQPAVDSLLAELRALPVIRGSEIDGEESDGTPRHWRDRPFVSLRKVERLVAAALTSQPAVAPVAPPGHRLVPVEPTPEMRKACDNGPGAMVLTNSEIYRAMLCAAPVVVQPVDVTDAAQDVLAERRRQVEGEGWTPEHDDEHDPGELSAAGSAYALAAADELHPLSAGDGGFKSKSPDSWPWAESWWKPGTDPRRMLVKAAALILAELERLDRASAQANRHAG